MRAAEVGADYEFKLAVMRSFADLRDAVIVGIVVVGHVFTIAEFFLADAGNPRFQRGMIEAGKAVFCGGFRVEKTVGIRTVEKTVGIGIQRGIGAIDGGNDDRVADIGLHAVFGVVADQRQRFGVDGGSGADGQGKQGAGHEGFSVIEGAVIVIPRDKRRYYAPFMNPPT